MRNWVIAVVVVALVGGVFFLVKAPTPVVSPALPETPPSEPAPPTIDDWLAAAQATIDETPIPASPRAIDAYRGRLWKFRMEQAKILAQADQPDAAVAYVDSVGAIEFREVMGMIVYELAQAELFEEAFALLPDTAGKDRIPVLSDLAVICDDADRLDVLLTLLAEESLAPDVQQWLTVELAGRLLARGQGDDAQALLDVIGDDARLHQLIYWAHSAAQGGLVEQAQQQLARALHRWPEAYENDAYTLNQVYRISQTFAALNDFEGWTQWYDGLHCYLAENDNDH